MTKKFFKSMLVIFLIISGICTFSGCGSKQNKENKNQEVSRDVYEAPLRNYMEGLKTRNLDLIHQAYPEFMRTLTQTDLDSVYSQYEAKYGSNIKMEYTLGDAVKVEEQRDLDILAAQIKELYPNAGDIKVTSAYIITVQLSVSGDNMAEQSEDNAENTTGEQNTEDEVIKKKDSQDFYVYEYNGNWYMF